MSRLATIVVAAVVGAAVALAAVSAKSPQHDPLPRTSFELDDGAVEILRAGCSHPVGFVWTTTDPATGDVTETWALFRERTSDGWLYPGPTNPDLTLNFLHDASAAPANLSDFLSWCASRLPQSLNVNPATDFAVHEHQVEVL